MEIIVNDQVQDVPDTTTTAELIALMNLAGQRLAVEVNREIVPRSRHETHRLQPGDRVEIVRAIGGG